MATREFTDSTGIEWRVWDVTPAHLHPITRAEEYMEPWAGGWLAFESRHERRRLPAPYPSRWVEYDLPNLEGLCRAATSVTVRRVTTPTSATLLSAEKYAHDSERATAERTFTSPRGRTWTVRLHECLRPDGTSQAVLRFTGGDNVVDLTEWPQNWAALTRVEYALLLLEADPPRRGAPADLPQRRREDRETTEADAAPPP